MTGQDAAKRAEEIVLAWANHDTYVGGEPTLREQQRLVKRVAEAIDAAVAEAIKERDAWWGVLEARSQSTITKLLAQIDEARREERARCAQNVERGGDDVELREAIAAALRRPPASASEGEK